ncbi:hypothetical protein [Pleurocapsa sp. PCC 7319]|uniref:hypothetical protein n=1 Tax=Pleurocapsa sp. PCC 7319 TaxID=118161 RepID=UPI00034704D9|nr:hypothetical protein [Pleurocapsa sp. PCC 7319]
MALALAGVKSRNYQKTQTPHDNKDLPFPDVAKDIIRSLTGWEYILDALSL